MNYRLQPRRRGEKISFSLKVLLLILVFVLVISFIPSPAAGVLNRLAGPLWKARDAAFDSVASTILAFQSKSEITRENIYLKEEIQQMKLKLLDRNLLLEENLALKEQLGRPLEDTVVLAGVLARPDFSPYDTFILDVGENADVKVEDLVLVSGTIVVGEIDRVFQKSSRARLYSSSGVETNVIVGDTNLQATAIGRGGGNFEIRLPREIDVSVGETIVSPGINAKIFGVVETVDSKPSDSFQTILFKNPVNMAEIGSVFIERVH